MQDHKDRPKLPGFGLELGYRRGAQLIELDVELVGLRLILLYHLHEQTLILAHQSLDRLLDHVLCVTAEFDQLAF